ncbi:MAG TPA: translation initiation factor IF-2 [Chroococcales cyanobacterium]|jgi:translation initiation factor IF-2
MNNGKVRIYELSRELNLDNKDILSICEGLNIAVKSHSSTITESEAERIRAASEKYSAAGKHRGDNPTPPDSRAGTPSPRFGNRPSPPHKPPIEIRGLLKPKSPRPLDGTMVATPPQPPVKPLVPAPNKPVNTNRPVSLPQQELEVELESGTLQSEPEEQNDVVQQQPSSATPEQSPTLFEPPARPTRPKIPQPNQTERPILKRNQKPSAPESGNSAASGSAAPVRATNPSSPQQKQTASEPSDLVRRTSPVAPVPRLQAPPKRVRPGQGDESFEVGARAKGESGEDVDETLLVETPEELELKLRRPTPPRVVKKKEWVDEEEDGSDAAKPGKAAAKLKRRPQLIEDEDEDFETDLAALKSPLVTTSEAVLRPAKPKSQRPAQPAQPTVASAAQRKKPAAKGESKAESRERQRDKKAVAERPEKVILTGSMTIRELATALNVPETEIIRKLFFKGMAVSITQTLDIPTASMVAEELGVEVETAEEAAAATKVTEMLDATDLEHLLRRPPVVTIMGHVDHGKTTLLDAIRSTKVAQGEAGGITQHIGAYHVDVDHEGHTEQVVFLDTPGHEAFTAMRARGARVTDIAILVVAADDGVQPQTVEAISHAKAAEVPIVVAINKIDKEEAQPDRVKQELTEYGLVPEEWGGETIMVPVSAIQQENLDTLLEMILLVAEVEDLQANPDRAARGTVIEANLDKTRGPVATLLVQNGTLRVGDTLVAGSVFGKVRAMIDDRGARVEAASPSFAVEILGLSDVPAAGDEFEVFVSEREARSTAQSRADEQRQSRLQQVMASRRVTLNSLSAQAQEGELKELNLILKADVQGSVEAILGALRQLPQREVQVRVLLAAAGEVTETDVALAAASGAVIVGFNTTLAHGSRQAADQEGVDIREYNIIYKLLDDIQGAMEGLLEPEMVEEPLGSVEVRAVFPVGRGAVAGCYVLSGKAVRNCNIRVRRGGQVLYEGNLDSLKRVKEDAREVNAGYECGIGVDKFNDWNVGDIIETYKMVSKRRTLSTT